MRRASMDSALLALILLAGCPARPPADPAPAAPAATPAPSPATEPEEEPAIAPEPTEAGFVHCCGNDRYKLEIHCGDMLKRCYESVHGRWRQTFGRHCKDELGEACYLEACERRC